LGLVLEEEQLLLLLLPLLEKTSCWRCVAVRVVDDARSIAIELVEERAMPPMS